MFSIEWRCSLTGAVPTTSEWPTILLPTKVRLIPEVWRYTYRRDKRYPEIDVAWSAGSIESRCLKASPNLKHTACIPVKLPCLFPGTPLKINGAPGNIQGNLRYVSVQHFLSNTLLILNAIINAYITPQGRRIAKPETTHSLGECRLSWQAFRVDCSTMPLHSAVARSVYLISNGPFY